MGRQLLIAVALIIGCVSHAEERSNYKVDVTVWYEAFNRKDPALLASVLSDRWSETPSNPDQPSNRDSIQKILVELTTAFPDFQIRIDEILRDGNKVIVRSEITGTQQTTFMGFPAKHRKLRIQAIDVHEFKDGKITRTWHSEDWLTGLRQLGVFDK